MLSLTKKRAPLTYILVSYRVSREIYYNYYTAVVIIFSAHPVCMYLVEFFFIKSLPLAHKNVTLAIPMPSH